MADACHLIYILCNIWCSQHMCGIMLHQLSIRGIGSVGYGWGVWNVGGDEFSGQRGSHPRKTHTSKRGSCNLFTVSHPTMHKLCGYSWATKNNVEWIYYVYSLSQNYFLAYWNDPQFLRNVAVCLIRDPVSHVTLHSCDYEVHLFLFGPANFVKGL